MLVLGLLVPPMAMRLSPESWLSCRAVKRGPRYQCFRTGPTSCQPSRTIAEVRYKSKLFRLLSRVANRLDSGAESSSVHYFLASDLATHAARCSEMQRDAERPTGYSEMQRGLQATAASSHWRTKVPQARLPPWGFQLPDALFLMMPNIYSPLLSSLTL